MIGMLGLGLVVQPVALAQSGATEASQTSAGTKTSADQSQTSGGSPDATSPADSAQGAAKDASDNGDASKTGGEKAQSANSAGYTWRDRPTRHRQHRKHYVIDPTKPLATAPSFRLLADGTSQVTLLISRQAAVTPRGNGKRVEYFIAGAQVGVANNTNPLVTTHFPTPLARTRLIRTKSGALLVLNLREQVQPAYDLRTGPGGTMLLTVRLPRPSRGYSPARIRRPEGSSTSDVAVAPARVKAK